jgi:hypothetical protein
VEGSKGAEGSNFVVRFVGGFSAARHKPVRAPLRGRPGSQLELSGEGLLGFVPFHYTK